MSSPDATSSIAKFDPNWVRLMRAEVAGALNPLAGRERLSITVGQGRALPECGALVFDLALLDRGEDGHVSPAAAEALPLLDKSSAIAVEAKKQEVESLAAAAQRSMARERAHLLSCRLRKLGGSGVVVERIGVVALLVQDHETMAILANAIDLLARSLSDSERKAKRSKDRTGEPGPSGGAPS